jgi:hypothetical protein
MKKQDIITFKVDRKLHDILKNMPNRSEFIRSAILNTLGSICPLCNGTGVLTPEQKGHWDEFTTDHSLEICDNCNELMLVCSRDQ